MAAVEVREERVQEYELGVGRLPDEEVRGTLLPRRAHEQVNVRDARLVEVAREDLLVDLVGPQLPCSDVSSDRGSSICYLCPAAVVDAELQRQNRVACRHLLGVLEFRDHAAP